MAVNFNESPMPSVDDPPDGWPEAPPRIRFDRGSLLVDAGVARSLPTTAGQLVWDDRAGVYRMHALHYRALVQELLQANLVYADEARDYPDLPAGPRNLPQPYPFQEEALTAWSRGKRGIIELPTGAGKTQVALSAMERVGRATLVLAPTLDLVSQWGTAIELGLGIGPGLIGGGSFDLAPVTVCTYASAYRHGDRFGDRFGLVVFDECHHLAAEGYQQIAEQLLAPYRLGLSATLHRPDGRHADLERLIGPCVYTRGIPQLSGEYLADYSVISVFTELNAAEQETYQEAHEAYRSFARKQGLTMASAGDWQRFLYAAARNGEGRKALAAFYLQKRIAFAPEGKFTACADLLHQHRNERVLIFSNDNATAREVSRRFLLPIITYRTRLTERRRILTRFRENRWPFLVTSRVLNEGVDVPEASVAIILSGTSSVREHVQRLGRILRRYPDKQAVLYEVLTRGTGEENTSRRRRQHDAYR